MRQRHLERLLERGAASGPWSGWTVMFRVLPGLNSMQVLYSFGGWLCRMWDPNIALCAPRWIPSNVARISSVSIPLKQCPLLKLRTRCLCWASDKVSSTGNNHVIYWWPKRSPSVLRFCWGHGRLTGRMWRVRPAIELDWIPRWTLFNVEERSSPVWLTWMELGLAAKISVEQRKVSTIEAQCLRLSQGNYDWAERNWTC